MPSDDAASRRWLNDIQYHATKAQAFTSGVSYEAFIHDEMRFYAVTRCLEIVSEASRRLPDQLKARHPAIAWREMAVAGNIYRHEYDNVAPSRIWHTVTRSLPPLIAAITAELADLDY